jgi:PKD repeat protein
MVSGCVQQQSTPTNHPPVAGFTVVIENQTVTFTDTSTDPDNDLLTYLWDFGDNSTSTEKNPVHTYTEDNKTYTATLTVTDAKGAHDSTATTISIGTQNSPPIADFTYGVDTATKTITFADNSTDLDNDILTYSWDFGDNLTSNEKNPVHSYANNGSYTVILTVNDGKATDTKNKTIKIGRMPLIVNFISILSNSSMLVFFSDMTKDEDGTIVEWHWDFGDGNTATTTVPYKEHFYAQPETYNVTLTVKDDNGATASKTQQITITA